MANSFPPDFWGYVHGFIYWLNWCGHKLSMANLFLPDLWGYEYRFGYQSQGLIAPLAPYRSQWEEPWSKYLSAGPCEISSLDLAIEKPRSYALANNIYLWRFSLVVAGAGLPRRGGCTKILRDVQKCCYLQEQDATRVWVWPPLSFDSLTLPSFAMWAPTLLSSKLRLLVARTDKWLSIMHNQLSTIRRRQPEWRVASYWQYEYNHNLSEGLLVINNTSAKMAYVVDNLCGRWPVWLLICVDDHLCGLFTRWKYFLLWYLSVFRPLVESVGWN